jgi:hypothetical protein
VGCTNVTTPAKIRKKKKNMAPAAPSPNGRASRANRLWKFRPQRIEQPKDRKKEEHPAIIGGERRDEGQGRGMPAIADRNAALGEKITGAEPRQLKEKNRADGTHRCRACGCLGLAG